MNTALQSRSSGFTYILTNDRQTVLYIGCTGDLAKRVHFHKKRLIPGFSKKYNVHRLVYIEQHPTIEQARKREKSLKGKTRAKKIALIEAGNPSWNDLESQIPK
jgi:putative endonuclease